MIFSPDYPLDFVGAYFWVAFSKHRRVANPREWPGWNSLVRVNGRERGLQSDWGTTKAYVSARRSWGSGNLYPPNRGASATKSPWMSKNQSSGELKTGVRLLCFDDGWWQHYSKFQFSICSSSTMKISGSLRISWIYPPTRIPVTTRISTYIFRIRNPNLNHHLPQESSVGGRSKVYIKLNGWT